MPIRPRDSQRAKIYASCNDFRAVRPGDCVLPFVRKNNRTDWDSAQDTLQRYLRQPWVQKYADKHGISLDPFPWVRVYKSKLGSHHPEPDNGTRPVWVNLSPVKFDNIELVRYLAQMLIPPDATWHGPEFVRAFLTSIKEIMGKDAQQSMVQILKLRKVRRRVESKEVRDRQRARYEKQRTKKAIIKLQETLKTLDP